MPLSPAQGGLDKDTTAVKRVIEAVAGANQQPPTKAPKPLFGDVDATGDGTDGDVQVSDSFFTLSQSMVHLHL